MLVWIPCSLAAGWPRERDTSSQTLRYTFVPGVENECDVRGWARGVRNNANRKAETSRRMGMSPSLSCVRRDRICALLSRSMASTKRALYHSLVSDILDTLPRAIFDVSDQRSF